MENKKCSICKIIKLITDFYITKEGRVSSSCKECRNKKATLWQKNHPEKKRLIQKKSRDKPKAKERQKKYYREWYKKNGRSRSSDYQEAILEWRKNNPDGVRAHQIVSYALYHGKITEPKLCQKCNLEKKLCAHHNDYSKPLEIIWLCYSCHKLEHSKK